MRKWYCPSVPVLTCLALVVGTMFACIAGPARLAPPFGGTEIPRPPRQAKPWSPPKIELPGSFVSATTILFQQGLADPRGCEYREISIGTGSCWGSSQVTTVHGWVLPAKKGEKQRFAVCWNGVVYPVVEIGQPAKLRVDVEKAIRADEEMRAKRAKDHTPEWPFTRLRHAMPEASSASQDSMLPLKACLLLRVGQTKLAKQFWAAWAAGMPAQTNNNDSLLRDPYLMLAEDWLWALFDRAVCAHMRSDDNLALASARQLIPAWDAVEKEADKRGFERPYTENKKTDPKYLDFLRPAYALLRDQERRAREKQAPQPTEDTGKEDDQATRITKRIQRLDGVSARQWGQPGGVSLAMDGYVQGLIEEGDAAVEPLLACLENDDRLTRSVHFGRDFFRHRSLIGVHEAAYVALAGILQTSFFGVGSTGDDLSSRGESGRRRVADEIRAYWERFRGHSLEERWYQILADDKLPPKQWLQAAGNIVQPGDVKIQPSSMFGGGWHIVPERKPGEKPKPRGEVLRTRSKPSVAELMAKRSLGLNVDGGIESSHDMDRMYAASDMALALAKWDPAAAIPVLRALSNRCQALLEAPRPASVSMDRLASYWARLAEAGTEANDETALRKYLLWLQEADPKLVSDARNSLFQPLWKYRDRDVVADAAESIFNAPDSPWLSFRGEGEEPPFYRTRDLFDMPLNCLPAFRRYALRQLGNHANVGTAEAQSPGRMEIRVKHGWVTRAMSYPGDPLCPKTGTTVSFRVCDIYADWLSDLDGTPQIKLFWPEKERDLAVAKCMAFLEQYGSGYTVRSDDESTWLPSLGKLLAFPAMERPASKEEVAQGHAVFCLEDANARAWELPTRPLEAKWTTLRDYPYGHRITNRKTGKVETVVAYQQQGRVWQAEEMLVDGQWKRFFGFVGRYCVAKVPAEEIEFPVSASETRHWSQLSGGVDARLDPPGREENGSRGVMTLLGLTDPLTVKVSLRNRRGVEQPVPRPKALLATLSKATSKTGVMISFSGEGDGWTVLETKRVDAPESALAARTLAPTDEIKWLSLDLHDVFTIKEPGKYSISLTFEEKEGEPVHGQTKAGTFSIGRAKKD